MSEMRRYGDIVWCGCGWQVLYAKGDRPRTHFDCIASFAWDLGYRMIGLCGEIEDYQP